MLAHLKIIATKATTFSETAGRQLSYGIPGYLLKKNSAEKKPFACIGLVHFGPFPQEISEVGL